MKWWSTDHDERLTCHYRWVEEIEMVLLVMVASKMMAEGGVGSHQVYAVMVVIVVVVSSTKKS